MQSNDFYSAVLFVWTFSDIQEFYQYTLDDDSKSAESKTEETLKLAERWQSHPPPVPSEFTELAQKSLDGVVCVKYVH